MGQKAIRATCDVRIAQLERWKDEKKERRNDMDGVKDGGSEMGMGRSEDGKLGRWEKGRRRKKEEKFERWHSYSF